MYNIVFMSDVFYIMSSFTRRISMHKSLNGK
jgi:hypothetical protein